MRVINSAVGLSRDLARPLKIVWSLDRQLNCDYDELFEVTGDGFTITSRNLMTISGRVADMISSLARSAWEKTYADWDHYWLMKAGHDFRGVGEKVLRYRICHPFYDNNKPFHAFRPVKSLLSVIERYDKPSQVGVHVRRTDNKKSISVSTSGAFIKQMRSEIKSDEGTSFFLATDSPEDEARLKREFPGKIVVHPKVSLDRASRDGARDALIDLFALSRCQKIIGSHFSSFTDVAAKIGGIEKVVAGL